MSAKPPMVCPKNYGTNADSRQLEWMFGGKNRWLADSYWYAVKK